jgi:hypothetical protein
MKLTQSYYFVISHFYYLVEVGRHQTQLFQTTKNVYFTRTLFSSSILSFFVYVPCPTQTKKQTFLQTTPSVIEITEIPDEEVEPVQLSPVETDKPQVTIVVEDDTKPQPTTTTTTTKTQITEEKTKAEKTKVIRKKVFLCLAFPLQSMMMMPNSFFLQRLTLPLPST